MYQYQVAVIGGGPGGYVAAIRAAQNGLSTVLIEKNYIGGTCLNIGCIPTKTLVKNAEILSEIKRAGTRGIVVGKPEVNMAAVIAMKNKIISQLTGGVEMLLKGNGVRIIRGTAKVINTHMLQINGEQITYEHLIVATGSVNFVPPVPGLRDDGIMTSTEILDISYVPEHLVIVGGGVIGCEFATVFSSFGSRVTIVEMLPELVASMDAEVCRTLRRSLVSRGIDVKTGCRVIAVEHTREGHTVKIEADDKGLELHASDVLVSVGRSANMEGLGMLHFDLERNYITVNDRMETSIPGVYAIGDITGKLQLAHVASVQGITAADNIAGKEKCMSYDVVPSCIYTLPEIGSVGLTEAAAREKYGEITVGRFPLTACGKAVAMGETEGFTKLIADAATGKVVGCHMIGASATELVGQAADVMHAGGTLTDITETIHAHPTMSETLSEAAYAALEEPIHMMKQKKHCI